MRHPGEHAGVDADAAVTAAPGCVLAVRTADCAPVVLLGQRVGRRRARRVARPPRRRGRADGRGHGRRWATRRSRPTSGPCIRAGCYEFDGPELDELVGRYGSACAAPPPGGRRPSTCPRPSTPPWRRPGWTTVARHRRAAPPATAAGTATGPGATPSASPPSPGWRTAVTRHRRPGSPGSASRIERPGATRRRPDRGRHQGPRRRRPSRTPWRPGLVDVGESYAQELLAKVEAVEAPTCAGTSSGGLQRNKVRRSPRSCTCGSRSTGCRWPARSPATRRAPPCSCR